MIEITITEKTILLTTSKGRLATYQLTNISTAVILDLFNNNFINIENNFIVIKDELTEEYNYLTDIVNHIKLNTVNLDKYKNILVKSKLLLPIIKHSINNLVANGSMIKEKDFIYRANEEAVNKLTDELKDNINTINEKEIILQLFLRKFYNKKLTKEEKKEIDKKVAPFLKSYRSLTIYYNYNSISTLYFFLLVTLPHNQIGNVSVIGILTNILIVIYFITAIYFTIVRYANIYKKIKDVE